jgi:hypothetical protein
VIDFNLARYSVVSNQFKIPDAVREISLGEEAATDLPNSMNPLKGISKFGLFCEKGAQTNWHVDFTGTSVFYMLLTGIKQLLLLRATRRNLELYYAWLRSGLTTYVYIPYTTLYTTFQSVFCNYIPECVFVTTFQSV